MSEVHKQHGISDILVATDGSRQSEVAVEYGTWLDDRVPDA